MKRNLNKKKLLTFGIMGMFAFALVSAVAYYALAEITLTINQPISVDGDLDQTKDCDAGQICLGSAITISNDGNNNKVVTVTNDNTDDDIEVGYVGKLSLTSKKICSTPYSGEGSNPPLNCWQPTSDLKATIYYTVLDDTFSWRYKSKSNFDHEDYTLIYYMDDSSNVDDADRLITLGSGDETITTKLPRSMDWNRGPDADYSDFANGFDDFEHAKGAKLWLVPTTAITGSTVDWSQASEFLFETDLIWYSDSETELTVPANSFIKFYPQFTIDDYATGGSVDIEITIA